MRKFFSQRVDAVLERRKAQSEQRQAPKIFFVDRIRRRWRRANNPYFIGCFSARGFCAALHLVLRDVLGIASRFRCAIAATDNVIATVTHTN
jgi:hypothetical protein